MKKQSLLLGFLFLYTAIAAQRFQKAPETDKRVKQIIEWKTYIDPENRQITTVKENVFDFDKKGRLTFYKNHSPVSFYEASLYYDKKGRLKEKKDNYFRSGRQEQYFYYPRFDIFYQLVDGIPTLKYVRYKNEKDQLVEEKGFIKGFNTGSKLKTFSRRLLNYNKMDSLFGEMIYIYYPDGTFKKSKIIHYYDPATKLKTSKLMYDPDGSLSAQYNYYYDEHKRQTLIKKNILTTGWKSSKKFLYKDGKLWQEIFENQKLQTKEVKVFKEGRLIREKEYENEKLVSYTDFQYLFW